MISVTDRLINKVVNIETTHNVTYGQKIIYELDGQYFLGLTLGYDVPAEKTARFVEILEGPSYEKFLQKEKEAKVLFQIFKKSFKQRFQDSVPVNARFTLDGKTIYFYFYSENRFQFGDYLPWLRKAVGYNIFLYQVGARDRVRLSDAAQYREGACGRGLCCARGRLPMPNVESENIVLQNLEARGVESLKGHCGKLKCSLNFEKEVYEQILKDYPIKGAEFDFEGNKYICIGNNIMTGEVIAKNTHGITVRLPLSKPLATSCGCGSESKSCYS